MIQRIQTLWLSLCAILSLFLVKGPFLVFTGQQQVLYYLSINGLSSVSANQVQTISSSFLFPVILILISAASILGILLYRNRRIQKIAVTCVIISSAFLCLLEGYYWNQVVARFSGILLPGIKMIFPVIIIILAILALKGIRKDENIVKSYDRLR